MENRKAFWLLGLVAVIALVALFTTLYHSKVYKTAISEFDMKAGAIGSVGIAPNSHFILNTTAPLSPQVIAKYVKVAPEFDFDVKEVAVNTTNTTNPSNPTSVVSATNTSFEIVPKEALSTDKIYTISIDKGSIASREFSWAYQVRAPFELLTSLPRHESADVPTNTGIELTFNREDIVNPDKYITISPEAPGSFRVNEGKVTFIPSVPLKEKTLYTIKIRSGLATKDADDTLAADKVIQFETVQNFTKNYQDIPRATFSKRFNEYANGKDVAMSVYSNNVTKSVKTTVYRFPNPQTYIDSVALLQGEQSWTRFAKESNIKLIEDKKIFTADIPLEKFDYSYLMRIPQELQVGHYAIVISTESGSDIAWFEVNPSASFTAFSGTDSLIWLKDIPSDKNIGAATLTLDGQQIGRTSDDGVALFKTPAVLTSKGNTNPYYYGVATNKFVIANIPSAPLVIPVENEYNSAARVSEVDRWWNYVSLNKSIFLPTDTIRFWTVIKPRDNETNATNEEITVKLNNSYWNYNENKVTNYTETKVKISEFGTVTGELSFANLRPGTYDLSFLKGTELVARQTVTVNSYIKPAYKMTVSSDKTSIFAGEPVTFKVKAEFFDGTPVSNLTVTHDFNNDYTINFGDGDKGNLNLNSRGEGAFTVTPKYTAPDQDRQYYDYWPKYVDVTIKPTNSEEGSISASTNILVFGPHISNNIRNKQTRGNADFTIKTNSVVINNNARTEPYWSGEDYKGPPVAGAITKVEVSQMIYNRTQRGTGYDSINKLTYPIYDYSTEIKPLQTQTVVADSAGIAQFNFKTKDKETYTFTFTTQDNFGRAIVNKIYLYGGNSYDGYYSGDDNSYVGNFYLKNLDEPKSYKLGDSINMSLQNNVGDSPAAKSQSFIFMTVNNGKIKYQIEDSAQYRSTFTDRDIPNVGIWSGWFDKGRFHNAYVQNISFDANERRLNIDVQTDKKTYKPGDNINLTLKVTDKNGNPAKAEVNVSALDAAVFALMPDEKDPVNDLYRDIFSQLIVRTSNNPPYGGGGAEKGGGDDGAALPRSNFQEIALFKSVVTDSYGYAKVQFKLPDNITSWRLTSQALTKDLSIGKDVSFIPVTLPFFLDATLNSSYLAGDDLVLRLRTFGTAAVTSNVNYSAESSSLPFGKISKVGTDSVDLDLGALSIGSHNMTMRASAGELSDALIRPVNVVDSYFTRKNSEFYEGSNGLKIKNGAAGYTTLRFSSLGGGQFYNELKSLSYSWGLRLDQKGASAIAKDTINTYFGDKDEDGDDDSAKFSINKYQSPYGGLHLLPYSDDELELSAISAHLFNSSSLNQFTLRSYLLNSLTNNKTDSSRVAQALYGLTAFKEPVLTKLQKIKTDSTLSLKDKIYVSLALDAIGAKEEARSYYQTEIKPSIRERSSYAYLDLGGDEGIISTTLLAVLTNNLEDPISLRLANFSRQNYPKDTLQNFERLLYIKSSLAKLDPTPDSTDVSFSYTVDGVKNSKTLSNGKHFNLTLSPQQLASFELQDVNGKLGVVAVYDKKTSYKSIVKDDNMSLRRNYSIGADSYSASNDFKDGDTVRVWLTPNFGKYAIPGAYQIVDYLPSGLRVMDAERYDSSYGSYSNSRRLYPLEIDGQKVSFIVHSGDNLPMYYLARVVSKGTYKAEPAIMQSLNSLDSQTISNEDKVTIK